MKYCTEAKSIGRDRPVMSKGMAARVSLVPCTFVPIVDSVLSQTVYTSPFIILKTNGDERSQTLQPGVLQQTSAWRITCMHSAFKFSFHKRCLILKNQFLNRFPPTFQEKLLVQSSVNPEFVSWGPKKHGFKQIEVDVKAYKKKFEFRPGKSRLLRMFFERTCQIGGLRYDRMQKKRIQNFSLLAEILSREIPQKTCFRRPRVALKNDLLARVHARDVVIVATHFKVSDTTTHSWVMSCGLCQRLGVSHEPEPVFDQCSSASLCWDVLEARGSWFFLRSRFVSFLWQTEIAKGGGAFVFGWGRGEFDQASSWRHFAFSVVTIFSFL